MDKLRISEESDPLSRVIFLSSLSLARIEENL